MVKNGGLLCDYAAGKGINIVMENHGFFINGSDRVLSLIQSINRPNLKMTVDVGNFLCVDEDPVAAVKKCLPMAEMIHLKDFYIRKKEQLPDQTEMFQLRQRQLVRDDWAARCSAARSSARGIWTSGRFCG